MLTLVSEHRIYGCHKLKNQGGKCTQWHGHQYKIILTLKAPYKDLDYRNMIMDTYDIEAIFNVRFEFHVSCLVWNYEAVVHLRQTRTYCSCLPSAQAVCTTCIEMFFKWEGG